MLSLFVFDYLGIFFILLLLILLPVNYIISWIESKTYYYSSIILYFGAEFTKAYAAQFGSPIHPSDIAVWVKNIEVEDEIGTLKQQEQKKETQNKETGDNIKVT